ncbi:MAG: HRDC domain-containing protein [Candidatus Aureabacteria bacterium]|nr:HRDC domain-containing protein [Candidatus Auribacterota bacterium]
MNNPGYIFVDTAEGLSALAGRIAAVPQVALDTEADSLHHYYEKICLIQLAVAGDNYIVDPLAGLDLAGLLGALDGKEILFHGADYDLRLLRSSLAFTPRGPIFDTMLAARLLGFERLGLAALAQEFLGVTLNKGGQKFDWSRRPLPEDKLAYAANDTRHLETLAGLLLARLRERGREEWHRETCEILLRDTREDRGEKEPDEVWRIKGLKDFTREQLALVRGLWHWREEEARQADIPPFKVLGNAQLIDLALWLHGHSGRPLSRGPKLPRNCLGRRLEALEKAIAEARSLPAERRPTPPERKRFIPSSPQEVARFDALRAAVAAAAGKLGIPASVLAPQASLWAIARAAPRTEDEIMTSGGLARWQARLLSPLLGGEV